MSNLNAYNLRDVIIRMSQRDSQFEQDRRIIKGITIGKDYTDSSAVAGREDFIWVKELGLPGGIVQIFNTVVPELVNLPVLIGYAPKPPFRRQVIGVNWSDIQTYNWYTGSGSYGSGIHAPTHEWPDGGAGNDVVNVFRRAIVPLRVYPGTGTGIYAGVNINVAPMYYDYKGIIEYYAGEDNVDLSAYVPTGPSQTYVLVYLNAVTNELGFASETYTGLPIVGDSSPGDNIEDHLPYFPAVPENTIPSAVVVLTSSATSVEEAYIIDVRSLWNIYEDFHPIVFSMPSTLTIDLNAAVTVTGDHHVISGGGLYTVLDTINGGEDYQLLVLQADEGETITVEHNAGGVYNNGNIYLNSEQDFQLSGEKTLLLFFNGTVWSDFGDGNTGQAELYGHESDPDAHHALVTLATGSAPILTLSGQELALDSKVIGMSGAIGMLQMFPGLVGLWPGSAIKRGEGGGGPDISAYTDVSGNGLHLTRRGGTFVIGHENGFSNYWFNGTTGYAMSTATPSFSVVGTESEVWLNQRGLTLGGWFQFNSATPAAEEYLLGKYNPTGNQRSYLLKRTTASRAQMQASTDGASQFNSGSGAVLSQGVWYFIVGRWSPSTAITIFINGQVDSQNTTSIPSTLFASSAQFGMGGNPDGPGNYMNGRCSLCFLCAAAVPDEMLTAFYQQTRGLFGV